MVDSEKMNKAVRDFQDLGELKQVVRMPDEVGASGVEQLIPDDGKSHGEAIQGFRDIVDENYSESLDRIAGENKRVVIERLVVPSDDLPYIEYQLVDDYE